MNRFSVTAAVLATLVLLGGLYAGDEPTSKPRTDQLPPAPEFTLKDSTGKEHKLSDYKDKIVVLEWTCSSCPFVIRHYKAKTMTDLAARYKEKGVVWLAIDSSHFVSASVQEEWRTEMKIPYPVLLDASGEVGRKYKAAVTPHLYIVKDGKIAYDGAIDDDRRARKPNPVNYVAKALDELIAGQAVSNAKNEPYG